MGAALRVPFTKFKNLWSRTEEGRSDRICVDMRCFGECSTAKTLANFIRSYLGAGETTPWAKCLLSKHEDISSAPRTTQKLVERHMPVIPVLGARGEWISDQPVSLDREFSERPDFKNNEESNRVRHLAPMSTSGLYIHMIGQVYSLYIHTHTHTHHLCVLYTHKFYINIHTKIYTEKLQ